MSNLNLSTIPLKMVATVITALSIIIGTAFVVDERYAHAESVSKAMSELSILAEKLNLEQRRWIIDDRIQELELKNPRTAIDNALLNRYRTERSSVDRRLQDLENLLRR